MAVRLNNGIVYDATFKRIFVKDITNLTNDQIAVLQCGDEVVKLTGCQKHTYLVTFKKDDEGMCLTYHDATYSETVSYDLVDGVWTYNSTDASESSGGGSGGGGSQLHEYLITFERYIEYGRAIVCATVITDNANLTINDLKDEEFNVCASGYFGSKNVLDQEYKIGWADRMYYDTTEQSIMIERTVLSVSDTGTLFGVDPDNESVSISDDEITITKNK